MERTGKADGCYGEHNEAAKAISHSNGRTILERAAGAERKEPLNSTKAARGGPSISCKFEEASGVGIFRKYYEPPRSHRVDFS
jgi:hypothetical protein